METDPIAEAEALIGSGRAAEAARALRARLDAGRGGLVARVALVKALLASGDADGALLEAREASALNPSVAVAAAAGALVPMLARSGLKANTLALRVAPVRNERRLVLLFT